MKRTILNNDTARSVRLGLLLALMTMVAALVPFQRAGAQEPVPPPPSNAPVAVIFIMDLSGSMNEDFGDGRTKLDVAKSGFERAFVDLSDSTPVGLRVYGDQLPAQAPAARQQNCETDTRLVEPPSTGNRDTLITQVQGFTAQGDTPIALAIQHVVDDIPDGTVADVVLFSDGRDECHDADLDGDPAVGPSWGPDPCDVARELEAAGSGVKIERINTVGFQAGDGSTQLQCIADATGGIHVDVETEDDVRDAIVDLGTPRTAVRLGGEPISGTPTTDGAPTLERIVQGQSNRRYTDTIGMNEERWYRAPEYGPDAGHTTVTVFDLPKQESVEIELRMEPGPDSNIGSGLTMSGSVDPLAASDSVRCGGCYLTGTGGESANVYWVVAVRSETTQATGPFDIEILLQDPGWGGVSADCNEGMQCWYESQIDQIRQQIDELQPQLESAGADTDLQDQVEALESELAAAQATRAELGEGPSTSTNWLVPGLFALLALGAIAGWVFTARSSSPTPATVATTTSASSTDKAVIGTIDLGGGSAAPPTSPPPGDSGTKGPPESTVPPERTLSPETAAEVPEAGREVPRTHDTTPPEPAPIEAADAAWYGDPDDPGVLRWWDGTGWTDHTSPKGTS